MHILPLSAAEIESRLTKLPEHVADLEYNPASEHPQSGIAVSEALSVLSADLLIEVANSPGRKTEAGDVFGDYDTNVALGTYSTSFGQNTYCGAKGYYWFWATEEDQKNNIFTLSNSSVAHDVVTDLVWNVGDLVYFTYTGTRVVSGVAQQITAVDKANGKVTLSKTNFTQEQKDAIGCGVFTGLIAWNHNTPAAGTVLIDATVAHAEGVQTAALNYAAHAEGYRTIVRGYYGHAEGAYSRAAGNYSHAQGYNTVANGSRAHAEGTDSEAAGFSSHAEGLRTYAHGGDGTATGAAHAEGHYSRATGHASHAEGKSTEASGNFAHAEGTLTVSSGENSHSEGYKNISFAGESHTEGSDNIAGRYKTNANGEYLDADGNVVTDPALAAVTGGSAHAEGYNTRAFGDYSHSQGYSTQALGLGSHAQGCSTVAHGRYSNAHGYYTEAFGEFQTVLGKYNIKDVVYDDNDEPVLDDNGELIPTNTHALIIGNGSIHSRSNACTVGWNGDAYFAGKVTAGYPVSQDHLTTRGYVDTCLNSQKEYILGYTAGKRNGENGEIFNDYVNNKAGNMAHAEGQNSRATGAYSHTEGIGCEASASHAHAEGYYTKATNSTAHAEGFKTVAASPRAHAEGMFTNASSLFQHVQGRYNVIDTKHVYAHIVGGGVPKVPSQENWTEGWNWTKEDWTNEANIERRNIHALDWYGNAYFAGDLFVHSGLADDNAKRLPVTHIGTTDPDKTLGVDGDIYIMYTKSNK